MEETAEFDVQIHEAGPDSKARVKSLFNYMQTSADRHSKSLGTSMSFMSEKNLTWVYSRFYAIIERYPELYEKVYCRTWRSDVLNGLVCREFVILDAESNVLVRATSSLALIDKTSRKPVAIPDSIISKLEHGKGRSIEFSSDNVEHKTDFDYIFNMKARYDDIDVNGHMNNASYAGIFFESLFENLSKPVIMKSIDISFRGEIIYGDELECGVVPISGSPYIYYHRLFNKTQGRISAHAVTEWVINF
jgi:medium-chain acyl-[acyl-carrier-protein] hydrolase